MVRHYIVSNDLPQPDTGTLHPTIRQGVAKAWQDTDLELAK
jgi:hypothetical protein